MVPLCLALLAVPAAHGQTVASLADLSLEQLGAIEVTSFSKRGQPLSEVAGSVFVVRGEDIRRSGATTLPEALRLAPNLFVARADANQYVVTARSGADLLANKMLVLIDGRTIYSPLFSGVFWEAHDLMLDDVDRIEVLSGSGGTLYGSNAFHGVINIITRTAGLTQGTLAKASVGNQASSGAVRYGGIAEDVSYRVWAKRSLEDRTRLETGGVAADWGRRSTAGFRADHGRGGSEQSVQGNVFEHRLEDVLGQRHYRGFSLVGVHTQVDQAGGQNQFRAYFDQFERTRTGAISDTMRTVDLDFQRLAAESNGHLLLVGAGWRQHMDEAQNTTLVALVPPRRTLRLGSLFAQDEWDLGKAKLTVGAKAEHNTYTGWEFLPGIRLAADIAPRQLLWAAWSRTVRTPSRVDVEVLSPPLLPNPDFDAEVARITELGWRGPLLSFATASVTLFHHQFSRLRSVDAVPGGVTFNNNIEGSLRGIEAWAQVRPWDSLRLQAGYVHQLVKYEPVAGTSPLPPAPALGNDPRTRYQLHAFWDAAPRVELFMGLRHVGALPQPAVPSYTALDLRASWKATPALDLGLLVRNANGSHVEWGAAGGRYEVPRSVVLQAIWRL